MSFDENCPAGPTLVESIQPTDPVIADLLNAIRTNGDVFAVLSNVVADPITNAPALRAIVRHGIEHPDAVETRIMREDIIELTHAITVAMLERCTQILSSDEYRKGSFRLTEQYNMFRRSAEHFAFIADIFTLLGHMVGDRLEQMELEELYISMMQRHARMPEQILAILQELY